MHLSEQISKVKDRMICIPVHADDGTPVMVTVETVPRKRSLRSNKYYFGALVRAISSSTGMTVAEVHDYLKFRFNSREIPDPHTSEIILIGGSTAEMTSDMFSEFVVKVIEVCDKLGIQRVSVDDYWNSLAR